MALTFLANFRPHFLRLAEAGGRLLFPPHCVVCGHPTAEDEDRYLCRACIGQIHFVHDPTCAKCGHEIGPYVGQGPRCANCRNLPLRFDRAVAAAHHAGSARAMVLGLKFAARKHNVHPLAKLLVSRLHDTGLPDRVNVIVPVPLHRTRARTRGFNQSELLALALADLLGLPVQIGNLRRIVDTPPQTQEMSLARRRANVKGAFAVRKPKALAGKSVLLVDDVLTTGATASECAGLLKRAGAERVFAATATRRMMTAPIPDDDSPAPTHYEIQSALPDGTAPDPNC